MPKALLIDLDGTLIDSEPWYKKTEVATLNQFGVPMDLDDMEEFTGLTLPSWMRLINTRYEKEISTEAFLESYRPSMVSHVQSDVEMFPDAVRFLERFAGTPAVLVTSSMKWYVDEVLSKFSQIADAIVGVVCEADVKIGKPDPEPYKLASELLKLLPSEAWVVEDAPNGVKSGQAAGCKVIGIDRPGRGSIDFADLVVSSLDDVHDAQLNA